MNELVCSEEVVQGWRCRGLASVSEAGGGQARLERLRAWLVSSGGEEEKGAADGVRS